MEFLSFLATHQAKARKLSAQEHLLSSLYFRKVSKTVMATGGGSASLSQSAALSSEQLQLVVAAVKEGMKEKLSSLKRELVGEREQSGNRLLKKLRM